MSDFENIVSAALLAAAGIGSLYVINNRVRKFFNPLYDQTVKVVNSSSECQKVVATLRSHCQEYRILGLDCEWVSWGRRYPVALLQLASAKGFCALIRLSELGYIPPALCELLNDPTILKVGVAVLDDAKYLELDYNVKVVNALDLRYMAVEAGIPAPYGLARLSDKVLGVTMDKDKGVSFSDWEAYKLSQRQIEYAANDAHVAVALFDKLAKRLVQRGFLQSHEDWYQQVLHVMNCYLNKPCPSVIRG